MSILRNKHIQNRPMQTGKASLYRDLLCLELASYKVPQSLLISPWQFHYWQDWIMLQMAVIKSCYKYANWTVLFFQCLVTSSTWLSSTVKHKRTLNNISTPGCACCCKPLHSLIMSSSNCWLWHHCLPCQRLQISQGTWVQYAEMGVKPYSTHSLTRSVTVDTCTNMGA